MRIDGHDVRDLTLTSLRAAIGVVSQDPHLFHESIMANLSYADPDASYEQIVAAARAARIHDTIAALPGRLRDRSSASAATGSRAARSSAWPSPGCC